MIITTHATHSVHLRPGDTPYPRPNPLPPLTPADDRRKNPDPL